MKAIFSSETSVSELHCDLNQVLFIDMAAARASNPTSMPKILPCLNYARHFSVLEDSTGSRVSVVGIATGYGLDDRRSEFQFQ
jgi:hypothetical protein